VVRLLRSLLLGFLCLSLLPGWAEALENLEHLVHDGHLAHAVVHEAHEGHEHEDRVAHQALEAEHGCTPMSHTCGCHTSLPAILPELLALDAVGEPLGAERPTELVPRRAWRVTAPPTRPPITA